jgi:polygalacturonase
VDPPDKNVPVAGSPGVQDVTMPPYSADKSGKLLSTIAIQSAIDKAAQSGGGIVYVPLGLYRVQTLMLKDGVTLYLADGAVIQGSDLLSDFIADPTFLASGEKKSLPAIIQAQNFKNIAIRGHGWIDAAEGTMMTTEGIPYEIPPRSVYRRSTIRVTNGTGFTVEGITAWDGGGWSVLLTKINDVQITRFKLLDAMWTANDGIDICGCNAVVDKCFVYTGDDDFCTKALIPDYPMHDVHFRNSIGYTTAAGVKVGMQALSPQTEIYFENMDIIHSGRGLVVEQEGNKNSQVGCPMQNIFFTDVRIEEVAEKRGESRNPVDIKCYIPGQIRDIFFKRVSVGNFGPQPSLISGFDESTSVKNIVFEDLTIGGKPIDSLVTGDFKTKNASEIKFLLSGAGPVTTNSP